ncbi:OmpA family protein [Tenacibaculum geojense]|uniref:OmpA family protein n=1 Tax=Tenacibaculum geojense TaxID=915352 RepID=A0ABW3JNH1_9FLAO
MKKIITLILISLVVQILSAQNTELKTKSNTPKADKLFKRMWYVEASEYYKRALSKYEDEVIVNDIDNSEYLRLLKKTGDCFFFNTDMENAHNYYSELISNYYNKVPAEYIFRYAHSLEGIGKYDEAKLWMKEFAKRTVGKDDRSMNLNQKDVSVEDVLNISPQFVLHNLSVNTENSDFGPMYYKENLVYSSAINPSNFHTRVYHWNEQPFLNMFVGKLNTIESDIKKLGEFSKSINTRYHEATLTFSPDYKRVYFTRNNFNGELKRDDKGTNHLKLYSADLIKNEKNGKEEWTNIQELPFNSDNYSVGHPALSKDGKLLYFVSDMPGSIGATDIFVVDVIQQQSNNHTNVNYSKPRNLGETVNTSGREMFPFITDKALYFSSDGHLGLGGLDIFQSKIDNAEFKQPVNLGAPLNSKLDDFSFIIKEDKNTGFVASNRELGKGDDDIYSFVRIPLDEPVCEQLVNGYVSNTKTGERISQVTLELLDASGKTLETTITDINGVYQFTKAINCNTIYKVKAVKTGYNSKEKDFKTANSSGETIVPLGLDTLNELIVEENGQLKIKIGIIYFDLNKSFIRSDAALELNKIVVLMMQYPEMVIKIESHTDSRNTDEYNLKLSDRRAKATRDYIISQDIKANRIESAIGYGETQLINKCKNDVPCTKEEHQLNRRSEFIIIKM